MALPPAEGVGARIAAARRSRRLTQQELSAHAAVSVSMLKKVESGQRTPSDDVLDAISRALDVDSARLLGTVVHTGSRIHAAIPAIRLAIDAYDVPSDGPVRSLRSQRRAVAELEGWRLGSQYTSITEKAPELLAELARALHARSGPERLETAALLAAAYRSADAVAYKSGYTDLSARLVDLVRSTARLAEDPLLDAMAAYVRTEVFFLHRSEAGLQVGLRALEQAVDAAPAPVDPVSRAALGALHMRAAVVAGRLADSDGARQHMTEARRMAEAVREGVYLGTAFGPDSYRVHEIAVAVELREGARAVRTAGEWRPPADLPAERRSHFHIDLARAQLWQGMTGEAFDSLQTARRIAPQHVREHPQVRETLRSLVRADRRGRQELLSYAEWAKAI
ncbi:helix-turn-helix domain-containing protein [Streptacidiphilus albus]|uniref:helix-turn-helix domain-containing protein n=1 Tax=Streptacidiphilus albus TaxID=105425 RepID=UPI00054B7851|nr:helix-turn-helix transcriptional regulator [Streptacidiphilus albus]